MEFPNNLVDTPTKLYLYKTLILPHLTKNLLCSSHITTRDEHALNVIYCRHRPSQTNNGHSQVQFNNKYKTLPNIKINSPTTEALSQRWKEALSKKAPIASTINQ